MNNLLSHPDHTIINLGKRLNRRYEVDRWSPLVTALKLGGRKRSGCHPCTGLPLRGKEPVTDY